MYKGGNKNKAWVITKAKQHRFGSIECFLVWKLKKKNRKKERKKKKKSQMSSKTTKGSCLVSLVLKST